MSIKFLVLRGGGGLLYSGFFLGGGSADFIFMGTRIFLALKSSSFFPKHRSHLSLKFFSACFSVLHQGSRTAVPARTGLDPQKVLQK